MFKSKYGNLLTGLLIVVIMGVVGIIGYFGYKILTEDATEKAAQQKNEEFDSVYSKRPLIDDSGQCLHAKTLGFVHPTTGKYLEFDSELPDCFLNVLKHFEGGGK